MEITKNFINISEEAQEIINKFGNFGVQDPTVIQKLNTEENRSQIYELINQNIILKVLLPKGERDNDINALIDLDGIEYFPKLYAYQEGKYLFMEKAQGISLPDFIKSGASDAELNNIKELLLDAFGKMIDRKRKDWDFKLEHVFWSKEKEKLTWIDFSICDIYPTPIHSKEDDLKKFEDNFKKKLLWYGREI